MPQANPRWAVITGASAGIGAAFARRLAAEGYAVLLVARRAVRLAALAAELAAAHNVPTDWRAVDLSDRHATLTLAAELAARADLDLLIHNAGFGSNTPLTAADEAAQHAMLNLHVHATYDLTHAVLPAMIARRQGAIIIVSSIAAYTSGPRAANYCASKAYQLSFARSLAQEAQPHGVRVQALCPGYTLTEFHDAPTMDGFDRAQVPPPLWDSADFVVAAALAALPRGAVVVIPGRKNRLIVLAARYPLLRYPLALFRRLRRWRTPS